MKPERRLFSARILALLLALLAGCSLFSKRPEPGVSDSAIQAQIQKALSSDPLLKGTQVNVHSADGIVELTGKAKSGAIKSRAGIIAASTPGVVQVHNDLLTSPGD